MPDTKNVLFVCTGNICRSPMAEALFRALTKNRTDFVIQSAGLHAASGQRASEHTVSVLREEGIDCSGFRSQPVTKDLIHDATHIFAMTQGHREALEALYPRAADRVFLFCEFCPDEDIMGADVPDPIGLSRAVYAATRDLMKQVLPSILSFIDQTWKMPSSPNADPASAPAAPARQKIVSIGADHGGFALKQKLAAHLRDSGCQVNDLGTDGPDSVDYPDFADAVCRDVLESASDAGILICTTGIGMSMAANRHPGIQAALVTDAAAAEMTRRHNDANVLCLAGSTAPDRAASIADAFLNTPFDGGRHQRRVGKMNGLDAADPDVAHAIHEEERRQRHNIELIASENFASTAVRQAQGSVLTNKYAEGYPGRRWYGGCECVDKVEQLAINRAREIFGAAHANVQPHSGSQANAAVYFSVLEHGDRILTMNLAHGGHLTHGHAANFSGKFFQVAHYGVSQSDERIDYDALEELAAEVRPKMITAGASAYPRIIDFERMAKIAKSVGAYLFVDMAHIAGLVAGGVHPSPVPHADFVTSTTHKSLRGPRGGIILCREEYAKKIDAMVFPFCQGGPLMHVIAAKAVCFGEALLPEFADYQKQVVANASTLAGRLAELGYRLVSGGTDNHLMMVDLRSTGIHGQIASTALDKAGITVNKNAIPFDPAPPIRPSGIRIGTPAVTTRGMKEPEMRLIAEFIHDALRHHDDDAKLEGIRRKVSDLNRAFPLP